jgi:AraC-like DNA-binding protein
VPGSSTALVRLTAFVVRESERLGADREKLLRRAGLSEEDLSDPDKRIAVRRDLRLWLALLELLPTPDLGIQLAQRLELRDVGLVGYLMLNSPVLGDALERLTRFSHILDQTYPPALRMEGEFAVYSSDPVSQPVARVDRVADWELAAVLTLARKLVGQELVPVEVRFPYPRPPEIEGHRSFFRGTLTFDHTRLEMVFGRADLDLPVIGAEEELGRYLETLAETVVRALTPEGSVVEKVERALWVGMKDGHSSLADVSKTLAMSQRSLQRSLQREGTTFVEQRDAFRRELAISLLSEQDLAVYEVAFLLGYSEPSAFHRAFRRWTDSAPREFRAGLVQSSNTSDA